MSLQDEVDEAAADTAMRLDIIVLRNDWGWLDSHHGYSRAKAIYENYERFRSPDHVVAIIEGRIAL